LRDAFAKFDTNGSGRISENEFLQAWYYLRLEGDNQTIADAFQAVDADGSGFIEMVEFQNAIKAEVSNIFMLTWIYFFLNWYA
jgi:Ca2+-binding EF-hand superfamily protein